VLLTRTQHGRVNERSTSGAVRVAARSGDVGAAAETSSEPNGDYGKSQTTSVDGSTTAIATTVHGIGKINLRSQESTISRDDETRKVGKNLVIERRRIVTSVERRITMKKDGPSTLRANIRSMDQAILRKASGTMTLKRRRSSRTDWRRFGDLAER